MDNYREEDGLFYWQDEDHSGAILVSQRIIDKYKLNKIGCYIQTIDEYLEDLDEEEGEDYRRWDGVIILDHCSHVTATDDESGKEVASPFGHVRDEKFVCWWNDVPIELLKEWKADVEIDGWSDG
jgi:hypothetical protein